MSSPDTKQAGLPMLVAAQAARPSLQRSQTRADFVSQLLAERAGLIPQRSRRRDNAESAIGAYADGARIAVKRMPLGYRTSILA